MDCFEKRTAGVMLVAAKVELAGRDIRMDSVGEGIAGRGGWHGMGSLVAAGTEEEDCSWG